VVVVVASSCGGGGGGWTVEVEARLDDGGGGGHTVDLVTGDPTSGSLALDLGARVSASLPCALTWIRVVCLSVILGGESSTRKISIGFSSSSSSALAIPSPPFLKLSDERSNRLDATE
jgi:hypothetical protein